LASAGATSGLAAGGAFGFAFLLGLALAFALAFPFVFPDLLHVGIISLLLFTRNWLKKFYIHFDSPNFIDAIHRGRGQAPSEPLVTGSWIKDLYPSPQAQGA
jgi:hypothetical protein